MSNEVKERFARIARKYDFMGHLLSLGADKRWRREAAKEVMLSQNTLKVLDLGTGTGDLAITIYELANEQGKKATIEGTDFTPEMIEIAKEKMRKTGISGIEFKIGDALHTGYGSGSFDVVSCGFLLRSLNDLGAFARETYRVLKKGGKLVVLDLAAPDDERQRRFFSRYMYVIRFLSILADREAYNFLVNSMNRFDKKDLLRKMKSAGFKKARIKPLSSGIAYLAIGEK